MKNPMNDDNYTGNDEQIDDLKKLVRELLTALEATTAFIERRFGDSFTWTGGGVENNNAAIAKARSQ